MTETSFTTFESRTQGSAAITEMLKLIHFTLFTQLETIATSLLQVKFLRLLVLDKMVSLEVI